MIIYVDRFTAEYGHYEGDGIQLEFDLSESQAMRFGDEIDRELKKVITDKDASIQTWIGRHGRVLGELNDLRARVARVQMMYGQRTAGVLHADAVMAVLGLPYEGKVELCERRGSKNCLDAACARRVYNEEGKACHPAEGKDLAT